MKYFRSFIPYINCYGFYVCILLLMKRFTAHLRVNIFKTIFTDIMLHCGACCVGLILLCDGQFSLIIFPTAPGAGIVSAQLSVTAALARI